MVIESLSLLWHGPFSFIEHQEKNVFTCEVGKKKAFTCLQFPLKTLTGFTMLVKLARTLRHVCFNMFKVILMGFIG